LALLGLAGISFACVGPLMALWLRDMHVNVSTGVGFCGLFGIAVMDGVLMVRGMTPLHNGISENLESWLEWREAAERAVSGSVEEEFRGYLECGILCIGVARTLCTGCGQGFVVAFSCQGRGVYPSGNGRPMARTAAHLVDHVIPLVPVRLFGARETARRVSRAAHELGIVCRRAIGRPILDSSASAAQPAGATSSKP